jgi:RNA polymerase sigma-70 factor (ECF subfamily)
MENLLDNDLVALVADGDDHAFLELYEQYSHSVYAFVLRMLQDPILAEEAAQDTFIKLWNHAGQYFSDRGSVQAWLLSIARNTALDCLRRESRRLVTVEGQCYDEFWQNVPDTNSLADETHWRSLHFAVQALSDEQRHIIDLAYYQGLSQSDISEILGWPLGTVKTRLRSAVQQLRQGWVEE